MFDLSNYPLAVIFSIGLAAILIVGEIGWQLGIHAKGEAGSNFSTLESAMLGLLALMLAFTFSMALTRFEARRDALLNEANAIGTTAPTDGVSSVNVPAIISMSQTVVCIARRSTECSSGGPLATGKSHSVERQRSCSHGTFYTVAQ
jgi:hypothetical protein